MKPIHFIFIICIIAMVNTANGQMNSSPQYFPDSETAVKKASSDLFEVINTMEDFNFGINPKELQKASVGTMIQNFELNFKTLLKADIETSISRMADKPKNQLFPLIFDKRVITVVELRKEEKGWLIAGFSSQGIADELNTIIESIRSFDKTAIRKYEVQNLNTNIYVVKTDNKSLIFSNYKNVFSFKEPVESAKIVSVLQEDARKFQKEFGKILEKEKLVY